MAGHIVGEGLSPQVLTTCDPLREEPCGQWLLGKHGPAPCRACWPCHQRNGSWQSRCGPQSHCPKSSRQSHHTPWRSSPTSSSGALLPLQRLPKGWGGRCTAVSTRSHLRGQTGGQRKPQHRPLQQLCLWQNPRQGDHQQGHDAYGPQPRPPVGLLPRATAPAAAQMRPRQS